MMNWNQCLYKLHQRQGGLFLGFTDQPEPDGVLQLEYRGGPLTVCAFCRAPLDLRDSSADFTLWAMARSAVRLQRPLYLRLEPLGVLESLALDLKLARPNAWLDCPELEEQFTAETDDPAFARALLRWEPLRGALAAQPQSYFLLAPVTPGSQVHMLQVRRRQLAWLYRPNAYANRPAGMAAAQEAVDTLEGMLALARAGFDALMALPRDPAL